MELVTSLRRIVFVGGLWLLGGTAGALAAQSPQREPLSVAEVLSVAAFADRTPIDLSPDGGTIAFTLKDPRRAAEPGAGRYFDDRGVPRSHRGTDVYVADAKTGATRRLSDGHGSAWGPAWSPDGRYLAFYSDRDGLVRVWLWDRTRDSIERLSEEIVRPYWGFEQIQWSPDGRRLLVKLLPEGMSFEELDRLLPSEPVAASEPQTQGTGVSARVFAHASAAPAAVEESRRPATLIDLDSTRTFLNVQLGDLALVDVPSGQTRRVAGRVRAMGYRFSPVGDRVAFTTRQPDGGTGTLVYDRYDLWVVDTSGDSARLIAGRAGLEYGLGFSWSPDGEAIAYTSDGVVHVVRARDGSAVRSFARDSVPLRHDYRAPLWLNDTSIIMAARDTLWRLSLPTGSVTPVATRHERRLLGIVAHAAAQRLDGSHVLVAVSDPASKRAGFQRVDLDSGTATPLFEADIALGGDPTYQLVASRDGGVLAFVAETGARPPDVWIADTESAQASRLTDLHPGVSRRALGSSRLIEWTDSAGRMLQGALLLPAAYEPGRLYPLVVKVYGGSLLSRLVNRFGLDSGIDNLQLLATRGYAVLVPDAPAHVGTPMEDISTAVLAGVDAVVAMGIADPDRIAIFGHSYGGYSALGLAVSSPRFRAVISSGGFSNLFSQYTEMREDGSAVGVGWSERSQGRMGGHPWDYYERYRENSPFFFLDRVTAPVLLLHGGSDPTVRPQRARETFVALRRLGKDVTLVLYDGEGHHPGAWSVENATDYWERIFDWLAQHLEPPESSRHGR